MYEIGIHSRKQRDHPITSLFVLVHTYIRTDDQTTPLRDTHVEKQDMVRKNWRTNGFEAIVEKEHLQKTKELREGENPVLI